MPRHFLRDTDINLESATNVPQLLHSSTATTSSDSNQPMCDTSQGADCRTHDFPNLFASPDTNLRKVLDWTRANATRPDVAEWLQQCNQWETAVTTRSFQKRNKRRKLCTDHLLTTTRAINSNDDFEAAMVDIRQQLTDRVKKIMPPTETSRSLFQYFARRDPCDTRSEIDQVQVPSVATDARSTYLLLHSKKHMFVDDEDFPIVVQALKQLRKSVTARQLRSIRTDPPKKPKTIRRYFTAKSLHTINFKHLKVKRYPSLTFVTYYTTLLVLAKSRRWLSGTELVQSMADAPPTPKTNFQLADAIKSPASPNYAPFGNDFEQTNGYSPIITRLLFYAEIHNCRDAKTYGTFSAPKDQKPYTYGQLQEVLIARRRLHHQNGESHGELREPMSTAADLAAKLCSFASDTIVVKHLIEFMLPAKKHADATKCISSEDMEVETPQKTQPTGVAANCVTNNDDKDKKADDLQPQTATERITNADAATEHTKENDGNDKRADEQRISTDTVTEYTTTPQKQLRKRDVEHQVTLSAHTAIAIANDFLKFVAKEHLQEHLRLLSAGHILVLCIFHSRLSWQKGIPIQLRDHDHYWIPKPPYIPAHKVYKEEEVHFRQQIERSATEDMPPVMQPPRRCCLCGKGFIDWPSLWKHCERDHHSWAEASKRTLWEAEQLHAMPLLPTDKRRIIQNFTNALIYSKPAQNQFGKEKVCMRQRVGCVICAKVEWIEKCYPCFLFQDCPKEVLAQAQKETEAMEKEEDAEEEMIGEATSTTEQRRGAPLKNDHGYYVINAHAINELLSVKNYIADWPQIPREELHASSIQHPSHKEYRWLLNTRRVPKEDSSAASTATEHSTPRCAGVGIKDKSVWMCRSCTSALCRPEPLMPYFALANWNWGGRLHPMYYNLSIATKSLLGLAIMICRLIVLRHSEHEEDQEKGFIGNTILLTQPTQKEIMQKLPPSDDDVSNYFSVCFNNQKMTAADLSKHKALKVDPKEYTDCSEYRKKVCPVFAGVEIDSDQVRRQWPQDAVPEVVLQGAQGMDTLHTFKPTLDGPASMKAATCNLPSNESDPQVVEDDNATTDCTQCEHDEGCETSESGNATEHAEAQTSPLDLPAEFLIGIREEEAHDPVDLMIVFQKNLELVSEAGKRIHSLEQRRLQAKGTDHATDAAMAVTAEKAHHGAVLVDLQKIALKMGGDYQQRMTDALASSRMENGRATTAKTLHIRSGKPLNTFEAPSWAAGFVEFLYGDCAPNLARPAKVGLRELFYYLTTREELEYELEGDKTDPLIPGGCYKAPKQSRWNTPEFLAIFADVVRKLRILQTTKHMWENNAPKWKVDIQAICSAKVEHFEHLAAILAKHGQQSMVEMMRAASDHKLLPLFKALQYVTFQTANIPLTQGYKMSLRHTGFAINVYDGPLSIFLTTNFADMYSPITVVLMNGAGVPLGKREVNLRDNEPRMPPLQTMHRELAKHPMLQVELFLLLDELVHTELLCMNAFIGCRKYGITEREPPREDDFASNMQIGMAQFVRSALKPLEAQGRGFTHGHEKVISVPRTRIARLKELFTAKTTSPTGSADKKRPLITDENELTSWCQKAREAVLQAACTLQYDSAVYTGAQLGVPLRPEPFSEMQQQYSRLDGQPETAADATPNRLHIPVTEKELNGHLKKEEERTTTTLNCRHPYKEVPLTGASQSMCPEYRLSGAFGRIKEPDEYGYYPKSTTAESENATATEHPENMTATEQPTPATEQQSYGDEYVVDKDGEITGFHMPNAAKNEIASPEQIKDDCHAWATSFARDQRCCMIQNHDHSCTATCIKYNKKNKGTDLPQRAGQKIKGPIAPKCRFRFFRHVGVRIDGVLKYVVRRGKELVKEAFIADGNEENEFGKATVTRQGPFRSSTSDVLQVTIRCNADYQYQTRAVPDQQYEVEPQYGHQMRNEARHQREMTAATQHQYRKRSAPTQPSATEQQPPQKKQKYAVRFLYGLGLDKDYASTTGQAAHIITTIATAMRAANVADFYMTKYLSKAQEALGPVIQPFIAGMRRIATAENAPDAEKSPLVQLARQRVRRFIFSANRTMWFSACELGVFLTTGDSCVRTEPTTKVFSGRGIAMMHECKRTLNHSTASEGLLLPCSSTRQANAGTTMDAFLVPMQSDSETDEDMDATEHPEEQTDECDATVHEEEKKEESPEDDSDEEEHIHHSENDSDDIIPPDITGTDAATTVSDHTGKKQMFTKSVAHRDDWLHRGNMLRDMDYYHYARFIERIEMPRSGTAESFQKHKGVYFRFEPHYPFARTFVQTMRKTPKTVQNVGPQCKRSNVNGGEDNAIFKAYFHSCVHCPGTDQCANPLMYRCLLHPEEDKVDHYLAGLQRDPHAKRKHMLFAPAWSARRRRIEILADRADEKLNNAKRIGVIRDTTIFKGVPIPRTKGMSSIATEPPFEHKMKQVLVQQLVRREMKWGDCPEHIMNTLMLLCDIPLPWHPDQLHLAEWQASSTREILANLDNSVEARNIAVKQAAKHKNTLTKDDGDDEGIMRGPKIVIEDLGGSPADLDDEVHADDSTAPKYELPVSTLIIKKVLSRTVERDIEGRVGRPKDMHKEMQRVAEIFGQELDDVIKPINVEAHHNKDMGQTIIAALLHQKATAEAIRQKQETETPAEESKAEADVKILTDEAAALLQNIPMSLAKAGPVAVAKHLVDAATLNQDQCAPVALIAQRMQLAWEAQGRPDRMNSHGRIMRMLLIGGGGCGKSRIVNLVLTALFLRFWGPRGCVKAAPSNKAARGIMGKTLHVISKLGGGSLNIMNLKCSTAVRCALAYLWAPCGALIIDEAPQGAAALYHAVALRSCYGREAAHGVELADYGEPPNTFGGMPIVIILGDELQLPPVPAKAGLFADPSEASREHLAGVEIFKQQDFVYRLSTMKRFTDPILIAILTKMRCDKGCKLTPAEWSALQNTDICRLPATERREKLKDTELWYHAAPTWATVSLAQVIRSRLSAEHAKTTLFIIPAKDFVLNRPMNRRLTDEYLAEVISSVPNMNNTGRLPSIALLHLGMIVRLTNTVEAPEAVTDSTGEIVGIDLDPDELPAGTEHTSTTEGIRILHRLPIVTVKLHGVNTEFLPPLPCDLHKEMGACRDCKDCDFRKGCIAVEQQLSRRSFPVEVKDPGDDTWYTIQVQRRQLPMTIKTASTIHTLQGVTAEPGLIFHWKFPRFFSEELRWLATYVALSRPPSLKQLISVGMPDELKQLIQAGPPPGILSRFNDMFKDKEEATHIRAKEVMQELGWTPIQG